MSIFRSHWRGFAVLLLTVRLAVMTINTWGYGMVVPLLMALFGGFVATRKGIRRVIGALISFRAAYDLWKHMTCNRLESQSLYALYALYPKTFGGTLLARVSLRIAQ